jgi:hypothetical protein
MEGRKEKKKKKEKEGIFETREKGERKYSNPLSTTLPGQCVTVADAHTHCMP